MKHEFALANIRTNKLEGKVSSLCRSPLDVEGLGQFDRICAFLKFQALENLQPLVAAIRTNGTLHFYNHESGEEFLREPTELLDSMRKMCARRVDITWRGKVPRKSISPNMYRVGVDFKVS